MYVHCDTVVSDALRSQETEVNISGHFYPRKRPLGLLGFPKGLTTGMSEESPWILGSISKVGGLSLEGQQVRGGHATNQVGLKACLGTGLGGWSVCILRSFNI